MAVVVKHNSTADGDPLIDGDDWNANHTITGGGTFRIPKHIETKTLSNDTGYTFSGLNGDTDGEYFVTFDLFVNSNDERAIWLIPGGATASDFDGKDWTENGGVDGDGYGFLIASTTWSKQLMRGAITIHPKTGYRRTSYGTRFAVHGDTSHVIIHSRSVWKDTATNITSLVLGIGASNTMTGVVKLYKMVDLTI